MNSTAKQTAQTKGRMSLMEIEFALHLSQTIALPLCKNYY